MHLTPLLQLAAVVSVAHAWSLTTTLVGGKTYKIFSSSGAASACSGLSIISSPVDFFDWLGNPGATTIEMFPGINCTGAKRTGVDGRNAVNPKTVYVSYRVIP